MKQVKTPVKRQANTSRETNTLAKANALGDSTERKVYAKRVSRGNGWQSEKSAMTQRAILEAAIRCFVELGYNNTTTTIIAAEAGVSRGAMMHHFPSRSKLMKAVVVHLHDWRLREHRELMSNIEDMGSQLTRENIRTCVAAAWDCVNRPSFVAYQELLAAARTDAELGEVIGEVEWDFEHEFLVTFESVLSHWKGVSALQAAQDLVQFVMIGMAMSYLTTDLKKRAERVIDAVTDTLMRIYSAEQQR